MEPLPNDMAMEVLLKVASDSMVDLYRTKICCKPFLNLIEEYEHIIYEHVSMQRIPFIPWFITPQEVDFLRRCRESGNPESLYREGMVQFFGLAMNFEHGLERLKEASEKGHKEATYVLGVILLCSEVEDERKQGIELLRFLGEWRNLMTCRNKVMECLRMMWRNEHICTLFQSNNNNNNNNGGRERWCGSQECRGLQEIAESLERRSWLVIEEEKEYTISCELCRCNYELRRFAQMCYC